MEESFVKVVDCCRGCGDTFIDVITIRYGFFRCCKEGLMNKESEMIKSKFQNDF
jgi:hypothetical protein